MKNTSWQKKCLLRAVNAVFYISLLLVAKFASAAGTDLTLVGTFNTTPIASGHVSTLTYTLTNTSASSASDIGFLASLPASQQIAGQVMGGLVVLMVVLQPMLGNQLLQQVTIG
ncbi:hypothetical protein FM037_10040 [Shewanella psychropiezotolerans]|uniref:DUF11 domain-containing protein n=1 Tax=Shewanella psychropiezotolerans TaxID=2593655 RepID=A0ABX5WWP3_9GAMM|nr:hypothetical protein [Shewanella psychropiezotolerans]QDO83516.1 hypothetical protein FM037_10040 [Shewanella psychropiezotolerans]